MMINRTTTLRDQTPRDIGYVPLKRLQSHSEIISRFLAQNYRVRATFSREFDEPYLQIKKCLTEIRVSAQMIMMTDPYMIEILNSYENGKAISGRERVGTPTRLK